MDTDVTPTASVQWYRIDQVAARTGLTKRTLRYYEEIGLLDAPVRTEGNYRLYSDEDLARLERICQIKDALGLSLAETREVLQMEERAVIRVQFAQASDQIAQREQLTRALDIARQQLALVEHKQHTLDALHSDITTRIARLEARLAAGEEDKG